MILCFTSPIVSEDSIERFVVIEVDGWNRSLMLIDNIREEAAEDVTSAEIGLAFSAPQPSIYIPDDSPHIQRAASTSNAFGINRFDNQLNRTSFCNFKVDKGIQPEVWPFIRFFLLCTFRVLTLN